MTEAFDPGAPPPSDFSVRLTDDQIEAFHRDGFVHVERITTDEELAWLAPLYDHLFARKGAFKGGYFDLSRKYDSDGQDFVPQVLGPEVRYPQLADTTVRRNALAIASQLLGLPEADVRTWGHMIMKPPHVGGELPWHQDEAYWDVGFRYRAIGCWVPLDPATTESGCMHFLPGSHDGPVRDHRHIDDDPEIHGLVVSDRDQIDDTKAVAVPLAPGGATFHHCRTLHRTPPNVSDHVRRAWANELQVEPVPLAPEDHPDRPWIREFEQAWERRPIIQQATRR
jgi:ectoine hydroxylase-related dioxygenase (phytanoyl-CoA dioxygenase family)